MSTRVAFIRIYGLCLSWCPVKVGYIAPKIGKFFNSISIYITFEYEIETCIFLVNDFLFFVWF